MREGKEKECKDTVKGRNLPVEDQAIRKVNKKMKK